MLTPEIEAFIQKAELVYEKQLSGILEPDHIDEFVAIEPLSGDYFLGKTLSDAIGASRSAYPDRLAHAMRVGHKAALHIGAQTQ
ncbi:MAG: hypothetical protein H7Z17_00730 [Fuerstia sp.]|nr:hypothetical protein [Fuerstiella sp.]